MRKLIAIFILLAALSLSSFSQTSAVSGVIKDTIEKANISNAVAAVLRKSDSVLIRFSRSDANGNFRISNLKPGNYIFMITHPRFGDYVEDIEVKDKDIKMGSIPMTPKSKLLQDIVIRSGSPIRIKGDTVEYTADSFRVGPNANVEELLKRMPGIQVGKDGEIKAMGETVKKVLVDGEEFFGDDPGMVVKNLRADAVNKVQVFDKKSEQAEFTGIDDGVKNKTINLQLKEDKKKGYFGKLETAGGLKNNYNNQAMINAFKGKRKLSAYALMGNINKSGLNWRDAQNYGGGEGFSSGFDEESGGMWISIGGSNDEDDVSFNTQDGFAKNWNLGFQYNNKWKDKHTLNSGLKYGKVNQRTGYTSFSQSFLPNTTWIQNTTNSKFNSKQVYSGNASYEWKIDSMNTLKFSFKANHTETESNETNYNERFNDLGFKVQSPTNKTGFTKKNGASSSILWKHKFKKPKRTLSWNTDLTYTDSDGDNYLIGSNNYFSNNVFDRKDSLDQYKLTKTSNHNINSKISYTEPLSKKFYLALDYNFIAAIANNDRNTYSKDGSGKYADRIDSLSNNFDQNITTHKTNLNFRYVAKKINYSFGGGLSLSNFDLHDLSRNKNYNYDFRNITTQASFNYNMKQNKSIRFNYSGSTKQPSLNQLQPLVENNDPINIYRGNPNLKQSFTHNFGAGYNFYDFLGGRNLWSDFNISFVQNAFANSTITTDSGKTYTQPVNVNGVVNANLWTDYGFKLKKSDIRFSIGPNGNYNRNIDYQNGLRNVSTNYAAGFNVSISKYKADKYDFRVYNDLTWNYNKSSIKNIAVKYFVYSCNLEANYTFPWQIKAGSDAEINVRQKTSEFDTRTNNVIWNAFISKDLHKNEFTLKLSINDILNQNNGFSRVATSNYFSQTIREKLQRYWLLTLSWNFSKNGKPQSF